MNDKTNKDSNSILNCNVMRRDYRNHDSKVWRFVMSEMCPNCQGDNTTEYSSDRNDNLLTESFSCGDCYCEFDVTHNLDLIEPDIEITGYQESYMIEKPHQPVKVDTANQSLSRG